LSIEEKRWSRWWNEKKDSSNCGMRRDLPGYTAAKGGAKKKRVKKPYYYIRGGT